MEQKCYIANVWLTWVGLPLLAIVVGVRLGWIAAAAALFVCVAAQVIGVRWFPFLSRAMGYGSVADVAPASFPSHVPTRRVRLYTAATCPFCPIVRGRLLELQKRWSFELDEIDVTFRPDLLREKKIRAVPVVEANGRQWIGNATTEQLADFVAAGAALASGAAAGR